MNKLREKRYTCKFILVYAQASDNSEIQIETFCDATVQSSDQKVLHTLYLLITKVAKKKVMENNS